MGHAGDFHRFLQNALLGISTQFQLKRRKIYPLLENPGDPGKRGKIAFYLLLHGGYITYSEEGENYFRIPNKEIMDEIREGVESYTSSLPPVKEGNLELLKAMKDQDFEKLGIEMTRSLYVLYLERQKKAPHPLESAIHDLILVYFDSLTKEEDGYLVLPEHGVGRKVKRITDSKSDESKKDDESDKNVELYLKELNEKLEQRRKKEASGFRIDLHLQPKQGSEKNHYIIELKRHSKYDDSIEEKALEALNQIYELNYGKYLMMTNETSGVIMMGLAAHFDQISLATQKIKVQMGSILVENTITLQRFSIRSNREDSVESSNDSKNDIRVNVESPEVIELDLSDVNKKPIQEPADFDSRAKRNDDIIKALSEIINTVREKREKKRIESKNQDKKNDDE